MRVTLLKFRSKLAIWTQFIINKIWIQCRIIISYLHQNINELLNQLNIFLFLSISASNAYQFNILIFVNIFNILHVYFTAWKSLQQCVHVTCVPQVSKSNIFIFFFSFGLLFFYLPSCRARYHILYTVNKPIAFSKTW